MKNRVVVTGLGVVACNGIGIDEFWKSLVEGKSGIGPITHFDAGELKSRIAGEVKGFDPIKHIGFYIKPNRMARQTQFALAATKMALEDADLDPKQRNLSQLSIVVIGSSSSAIDLLQRGSELIRAKGLSHNTPYIASAAPLQAIASAISEYIGMGTQTLALSTACAAGLDAIGSAFRIIQSGQVDVAITGGTDALITNLSFSSFDAADLTSSRNDDPPKASRPFDFYRGSGVISEGAGIVVLENLEHALARGRTPYIEIIGYGNATDSHPDRPASGFEKSMKLAITNAGKRVENVDYICAHGPGHPILDRIETEMIEKVFGEHAYSIPVSSIKGVVGNPFAAAGPIQLIACSLAMKHSIIPQTANYEIKDPECNLDYVSDFSRRTNVDCALINVHGIGGTNSSLVVERLR